MSMDSRRPTSPPTTSRKAKRLSNVNEEMEKADKTDVGRSNSINFSRPISPPPRSPTSPMGSPTMDKPYTHGTGAWFSEPEVAANGTQKSAKQAALDSKIARIQAAAGQPVQKSHADSSAQGTYLAQANKQPPRPASTEPKPTSYETSDAIMVYDPNSRTFVPKPREKPKVVQSAAPVVAAAAAPTLPPPKALAPGTYDPNTRTIVPARPGTATGVRTSKPTLDTDLAPPPRNPARLSPISSPFAANLIKKQPSVVREEPELQGKMSRAGSTRTQTITGPPRSYMGTTASKQRSSSLDIPRGSLDRSVRGRGTNSPSPARSAHFSPSPVIEATRHDPPSRDISPAKSALKHSPSAAMRTHSPLAHYAAQPKSPGADMSDTTSQASEDAFTGRKKKSVRVSFDEQPHEIEAANAVPAPKTIGGERSPALDDVDDEELMKPRPALPSFGSIRSQRVTPEVAEKVTEMAPERHDTSNDHAIGGILRSASEDPSVAGPVPPEVRSKESAGYESDESESLGAPDATSTPAAPALDASKETEVKDFAPAPDTSKTEDGDVPAITLLPPTPGVDEDNRTLSPSPAKAAAQRDSQDIEVPGGWSKEDENQAEVSSAGAATATASTVEAQDQTAVVPENPIIYQEPDDHSPMLAAIDEDTDTDEFSDAAEDLSELDNGGFASLDAIAVSPVVDPSKTEKSAAETAAPPESPTAKQASKKAEGPAHGHASKGSSDWSEATAYWSRLSRQQREQIEREHLSSDDEARPAPAMKKKKKVTAKQPDTLAPAAAKPPVKPAMKKSMRAQPEPTPVENEVHMRRSMRPGSTGGGMATSLRDGSPASKQPAAKAPMQNKSMRPASATGLPASAAGAATRQRSDSDASLPQSSAYPKVVAKPKPQTQVKAAPVMTAKLQKELGNDSDSESSFRKKRRTPNLDASGRYTMKRSMRGGPTRDPPAREQRPVSPTPPPGRGKGKDSFSIRSLSPTGSLFGRKKQAENVRQSLRSGSVDAANTRMSMRSRPVSAQSTRPVSSQPKSKFKSRFNDSDDEGDDNGPGRPFFKSRFADSDDEDDDVFIPADLTPVRGIPRRAGQNDGDSTDLEDEDEDESSKTSRWRKKQATPLVPDSADIDKAMEAARKKLGITDPPSTPTQNGKQGSSLQQGSLRNSQIEPKSRPEDIDFSGKKKRGFMGSILRRNRNSTASIPTVSSPAVAQFGDSPAAATASPSSVRPETPTSPSGGNKLIRRNSAQQGPRMKRGDSTYSNATAPPAVGESDVKNADWPLPPVPAIPDRFANEQRPNTSDGPDKVRFQDVEGGDNVYNQRTGKKKKFSKLRRVFRLDD